MRISECVRVPSPKKRTPRSRPPSVTPVQAKMIFLPGARSCGFVDALGILDAHLRDAFVVLGFGDDEARENFAVEAAQRRGGENAFGRAARAHHGVNAGADDGGADAGGKVAIGDQADARAGGANIGDQFFMARAVENDDDEVFHFAVEALGDGAKIVGDGRVQIHGAFARRADDDFLHVKVGRVEQAAGFAGGEHDDGVRLAGGAEVGAFERVHGDNDFWIFAASCLLRRRRLFRR